MPTEPKACRSCSEPLTSDERWLCPACWELAKERGTAGLRMAGKGAMFVATILIPAVVGKRRG